ncbi:MAG: baseplate J/gp47 family protein [Patescibacteria group bacterium]
MEPTNLPSASEMSKLFITILINEKRVQAALGGLDADSQAQAVAISKVRDFNNEETSLIATDESLQDLGPDSENVDEVIFALEPDWITGGDLDTKRKPFLKKLTENLSLKPIGFVLTTEALAQYLQQTDKYLSAICLYCRQAKLHLLLFKQGKLLSQIEVGRSGDLLADVHEALARQMKSDGQGNQLFPAKILLISSAHTREEVEDHQQQILSYQWTENYPFLQMPSVELLPEETMIKAVVGYGGQAVFGGSQGLNEKTTAGVVGQAKTEHPAGVIGGSVDEVNEQGFVATHSADRFVAETGDQADLKISRVSSSGLNSSDLIEPDEELASSFGVPVDLKKVPEMLRQGSDAATGMIGGSLKAGSKFATGPKHRARANPLAFFKQIGLLFSKRKGRPTTAESQLAVSTHTQLHQAESPHAKKQLTRVLVGAQRQRATLFSHKTVAIIGVTSGLVALTVLAWAFLSFGSKIHIRIKPSTKVVSKEVQFTLDPKADNSDPAQLVLKASLVSKELMAEDSWQATGVKLVGEKAKGTVTIFNKTDSEKSFPAGTVLKTDKFEFSLDEEVRVASASSKENSSGDGETKNYGKANVKVTANEIGADYNLAKGTDLQVASFANNSYSATVLETFSGGSSREIRAVSAKDQKDLLEEVTKKILNDSEKIFKEESKAGKYLVPTGDIKFTKKIFSADVGEEVETFTLKATATVQAVSYLSSDLKPLVVEILSAQTPPGYTLQEDEPEILSSPANDASGAGKVKLNANISLKAKPSIQLDDLRGQVVGKTYEQAKSVLEANEMVSKAEITYQPVFASFFVKTMPKDAERVIIEVTN